MSTLSVFLPTLISSSSVWVDAGPPHKVGKIDSSQSFFMIFLPGRDRSRAHRSLEGARIARECTEFSRPPPHGVLPAESRASRGYHIRADACCASQQNLAGNVACGSKAARPTEAMHPAMSASPPKAELN